MKLLFLESPFLFHCLILLLWNAPFLTKETAGGWSLNEQAASGNRGFSRTGPLAEAAGGCCQLVALRVALSVWKYCDCNPGSVSRVKKGAWDKEQDKGNMNILDLKVGNWAIYYNCSWQRNLEASGFRNFLPMRYKHKALEMAFRKI